MLGRRKRKKAQQPDPQARLLCALVSLFFPRLKNWFRQKSRSRKNGQEETVAVPEVHTGKVRHEAADSTPEADCPIHYDNVAIPEIHIHPRKK